MSLTIDGAIDGVAHILEVLYGAVNQPYYDQMAEISETGISLVVDYLPQVVKNPEDADARKALCLATDFTPSSVNAAPLPNPQKTPSAPAQNPACDELPHKSVPAQHHFQSDPKSAATIQSSPHCQ